MIQISGLTRRFGDMEAVDDLNLSIRKGEIFGLVGPDGAGKTTTLRLLCGLLAPDQGHVQVAGFDVSKDHEAVKDRIGYMAQRFGLYGDLTVEENMAFYADLFNVTGKQRDQLMSELLEMTRMVPFRGRQAHQLSGGMKQKLALMCTLLHHPRILFLDEPTNGVDPVSRRDFWAIIYRLVKEGMTVLVTTAYLDEAERCNRVGLMHRGKIVRCDEPQALRSGLTEVCYEVYCKDPRRARELLRSLSGVLSVEPAGTAMHLFLSSQETTADALRQALDDKGLGPSRFKSIDPSLEDIFIALIRKASQDDSA
jgi:ABC-2 type transport system ATP-binding protein